MTTYTQNNLTDHIVPEWLRMQCKITKMHDNNQYNIAIDNITNIYMSHYLDYDDYLLDSTFPEDHNLTLNENSLLSHRMSLIFPSIHSCLTTYLTCSALVLIVHVPRKTYRTLNLASRVPQQPYNCLLLGIHVPRKLCH